MGWVYFPYGQQMNDQAFLLGNQDFFPKSAVAGIRNEHTRARNFRRRYIEENRELSDDELLRIASQTRRQLEDLVNKQCAEELATFLAAGRDVSRQVDGKEIPRPSFIIVDRKPKSDYQRALRSLLKRWLYCVGGVEQVRSGLADRRIKAFSWLLSAELSIGLERNVRCPACEMSGKLTLHTAKRVAFACACGHWDDYESDASPSTLLDDLPLICNCAFCQQQKNDFAQKLRNILAHAESTIADSSRKWAGELDLRYASARTRSVPDEEDMRRDYLVGRDNISKSLRSILALRPKAGDDFLECVERVVAPQSGHRSVRTAVSQLLAEARKHKIVYGFAAVDRTDVHDMAEAFACEASLFFSVERGCGTLRTERNAPTPNQQLLDVYAMLVDRPVSELQEAIEIHDSCVTMHIDGYRVFLFDELNRYGTILSTRLRAAERVSYAINPYFISGLNAHSGELASIATSTANLFNSKTEGKAYARLVMENPGSIVVPNRLLVQVIGRQKMKDEIAVAFDSKDRTYLFSCEVDFAVYDGEGRILYVEEMQRGEHHDDSEWIRKDALKRAALGLAGIPFRESF